MVLPKSSQGKEKEVFTASTALSKLQIKFGYGYGFLFARVVEQYRAPRQDPAGHAQDASGYLRVSDPSQPLLGESNPQSTQKVKQARVTEAWGIYGDADLMPYRKKILQKSMVATGQRGAVRAAEECLSTGDQPPAAEPGEELVTEENIMLSLRVVRGKAGSGKTSGNMEPWQHLLREEACGGDEDGGPGFVGIVLSFDTKRLTAQASDLAVFKPALGVTPSLGRRNSQEFFATKFQTMIVLDWDDSKLKDEVASKLAICQTKVVDLLKQATDAGKVILVTLARKPWVLDSCRNFFPTVGQAITELNVPVIYAQDGAGVVHMSSNAELERFWSGMKARAIARECREFYSQYDGQSWKNVISIGDSDFERLGTMLATKDYMAQTGIQRADNSDNCAVAARKTLKMVDQPSIDELNTQLGLLRTWLPLMIKLDSDFDLNLNNAADPSAVASLSMVDLAGLSALTNVIMSLSREERTFLLRDSLGGNSKTARHLDWSAAGCGTSGTGGAPGEWNDWSGWHEWNEWNGWSVLVANVSPSQLCLSETLSTLKFAARAKHIRCTVVRNEAFSGTVESLMEEVQILRNKLAQLSGRSFDRTPVQSQLMSPGSISEGVEDEPEAEDVGFRDAANNDLEEQSLSDRQRIARLEVLLSAALEREASAEQRRFRLKRLANFLEDLDFRKCHRLRKLHAEYVSQLAPQVEGSAIADDMEVRELSAKLKSFGHHLANLTRGARLEDGDYGYGVGMDSDAQSTEASSGTPMDGVEDQAAISGDEAKFIREENRMLRRQLENHPEVQRMIAENWALREELRALDPAGWPRVPGQPVLPAGLGDGERALPSPPSISSEVLASVEADDESSSKTWFYFQKMAKEVEELMRAKESLSRAIERTQRDPSGASQGVGSTVQSLTSQPAKEASGAVPVSLVVELDIATQEALKQAQGLLQGPGCARLPAVTAAGAAGRRGAKEVDDGRSPERGIGPPEQVGTVPCDDEERFKQVDLVSAAYGDAFDEFQRLREYESRLEECQFFELQCSLAVARAPCVHAQVLARCDLLAAEVRGQVDVIGHPEIEVILSLQELRELTGADPLPEDLSVLRLRMLACPKFLNKQGLNLVLGRRGQRDARAVKRVSSRLNSVDARASAALQTARHHVPVCAAALHGFDDRETSTQACSDCDHLPAMVTEADEVRAGIDFVPSMEAPLENQTDRRALRLEEQPPLAAKQLQANYGIGYALLVNMGYSGGGPTPLCGVKRLARAGLQEDEAIVVDATMKRGVKRRMEQWAKLESQRHGQAEFDAEEGQDAESFEDEELCGLGKALVRELRSTREKKLSIPQLAKKPRVLRVLDLWQVEADFERFLKQFVRDELQSICELVRSSGIAIKKITNKTSRFARACEEAWVVRLKGHKANSEEVAMPRETGPSPAGVAMTGIGPSAEPTDSLYPDDWGVDVGTGWLSQPAPEAEPTPAIYGPLRL
ncbi:KIN12F [Symbiodinium microadriaticum]|nr:KIN12F [Symbiodinium microadriaticum]